MTWVDLVYLGTSICFEPEFVIIATTLSNSSTMPIPSSLNTMIDNIKSEMLASFKASVDVEKPKLVTGLEENSTIEFKKSLHTNG